MTQDTINKSSFQISSTDPSEGTPTWNGPYYAKSIKPSLESLASSSSGRTDDGVMHVEYIQTCLRKWEIEMPTMDATEVYNLTSLIQGKVYWIKVWDISTAPANNPVTVKVYTSNSSSECYSGFCNGGMWNGFTFSAVELGTSGV